MEHTPGLETSPPGSDTLEVAGALQRSTRPIQQPLIATGIDHRAAFEQRAIPLAVSPSATSFTTGRTSCTGRTS